MSDAVGHQGLALPPLNGAGLSLMVDTVSPIRNPLFYPPPQRVTFLHRRFSSVIPSRIGNCSSSFRVVRISPVRQKFNFLRPSVLNLDLPPSNSPTSSFSNYCRRFLRKTVKHLGPQLAIFRLLAGRRSKLMPKAAFCNRHLTFYGTMVQWGQG